MDTVGGVETWFERRSLDGLVSDFQAGVRPLIYNRPEVGSLLSSVHLKCQAYPL
jgi:hypothetical protein